MSEALAAAGIKKGVQEKWQLWLPEAHRYLHQEMMDKLNDLATVHVSAPYKMIMAVATDKNP